MMMRGSEGLVRLTSWSLEEEQEIPQTVGVFTFFLYDNQGGVNTSGRRGSSAFSEEHRLETFTRYPG